MSVNQRNPDGTWTPAVPVPYQRGWDAEVSRDGGRYRWQLYRDGAHLIASGSARSRPGLHAAMLWARLSYGRRGGQS